MKTPDKVTGSQCLEFVNRPIGFCSQTNYSASAHTGPGGSDFYGISTDRDTEK